MISAIPVTNISYILENDLQDKLGLLIKSEKLTYITPSNIQYFDNISDLEKLLNEEIKFKKNKKPTETIETYYINEYPIKHGKNIYNIEDYNKTVSYTITENSNVKYLAGYWIVNDTINLNPKLSTIDETCHGPYKNEFDAKADSKIIGKK